MSISAWEAVFMLVVLKIPLVYIGAVVWWAIRAVPDPADRGEEVGVLAPLTPCGWDEWKRRRSGASANRPLRPYGRAPHAVRVRAA